MRTRIILTLICLLGALLMSMSSCNHHIQQPINDIPEVDTCEQSIEEYLPTVYDILQEREDMRYMRMIDSVYLTIPEPILVNMLFSKGTTMSILEIVEDYLRNKSYYHDTILSTIRIDKKYEPDSVPKKSIPNFPTDTISQN